MAIEVHVSWPPAVTKIWLGCLKCLLFSDHQKEILKRLSHSYKRGLFRHVSLSKIQINQVIDQIVALKYGSL